MSTNLPKPAVTELNKALGNADHLTKLIINPLIGSINDAIESIILTIHQEDFNMCVNLIFFKFIYFKFYKFYYQMF